jgi:uncharacterized membrane protein
MNEQNIKTNHVKRGMGRVLTRVRSIWGRSAVPVVVFASAVWPVNPAVGAIALLGALIVPGVAVMMALDVRPAHVAARLGVAAAIGSALLMLTGFAASLIGPAIGVERPLDRAPQLWILAIELAVASGIMARTARSAWQFLTDGVTVRWSAALCALPALSLLGTERLNAGAGADLAQIVLFMSVGVLAAATIMSFKYDAVPGAAVLYGTVLSVVWATAARGSHLYGWDIQQEFGDAAHTAARGIWTNPTKPDPYKAMLSITSFPSQLSSIAGISVESVFRYVFPAMLATVPVIVYLLLKRSVQTSTALVVSGALVASALSFVRQMPSIGRQEVAFFIFSAAVYTLTDTRGSRIGRRLLAVFLLSALSCTHYTTAYMTTFLVVAAACVGAIVVRRQPDLTRVITLPFAGVVTGATLLWNLVITRSGLFLERPVDSVSSQGLGLLPRDTDTNVLAAWIQGTGPRLRPFVEYAPLLKPEFSDRLHWMQSDPRFADAGLRDAPVPTSIGPFHNFSSVWNLMQIGVSQTLVLLVVTAVAWLGWFYLKQDRAVAPDLIGMSFAALPLSVVLRTSDTAGQLYNPERGALHMAIVLAIPVGLMIDRMRRNNKASSWVRKFGGLVFVALLVVPLVGRWGVAPYIFQGSPPAATSTYGEDLERFSVSKAELATAQHLSDILDSQSLVQTDRYGALVMLDVAPSAEFGLVGILHPDAIDKRAYVYLSRANTLEGRARGQMGRSSFRYDSPLDALDGIRALIYSTEETRVYR